VAEEVVAVEVADQPVEDLWGNQLRAGILRTTTTSSADRIAVDVLKPLQME